MARVTGAMLRDAATTTSATRSARTSSHCGSGDALAILLQDQRPRIEVIVDAACTFLSGAKTSKRDSNRRGDLRLCPACMHRGLLEQIFVMMSDLGDGTLNVGQIFARSQQDILRQPDALIRPGPVWDMKGCAAPGADRDPPGFERLDDRGHRVQRGVSRHGRNPFRDERLNESRLRQTAKRCGPVPEDVQVSRMPRHL